jgi:hypothetical protein
VEVVGGLLWGEGWLFWNEWSEVSACQCILCAVESDEAHRIGEVSFISTSSSVLDVKLRSVSFVFRSSVP